MVACAVREQNRRRSLGIRQEKKKHAEVVAVAVRLFTFLALAIDSFCILRFTPGAQPKQPPYAVDSNSRTVSLEFVREPDIALAISISVQLQQLSRSGDVSRLATRPLAGPSCVYDFLKRVWSYYTQLSQLYCYCPYAANDAADYLSDLFHIFSLICSYAPCKHIAYIHANPSSQNVCRH